MMENYIIRIEALATEDGLIYLPVSASPVTLCSGNTYAIMSPREKRSKRDGYGEGEGTRSGYWSN